MKPVKVTFNSDDLSLFKAFLDVENAPDTHNPNLPGSPTVRPVKVMLLAYPEDGTWQISLADVKGPKVHASSGNLTKRHYEATFVNPMEDGAATPEWLLEICRKWQDRLNGIAPFSQFQIYASRAFMVCEQCDTNVTYGDEDPRLSSLVEAAAAHTCTPEDLAKARDFRTG